MKAYPRYDAGHDFAGKWPRVPDWALSRIEAPGLSVVPVSGLHQLMISGALDRVPASVSAEAREVGLWGRVSAYPVLVRIGRDRGLLVSLKASKIVQGWQEGGWCATAMNDAWRVFDISGPATIELVRRAVSADLEGGSPSAAVLFANVEVLLYRTAEDCARLHVEAPLAPFLWRWMETQAAACQRWRQDKSA